MRALWGLDWWRLGAGMLVVGRVIGADPAPAKKPDPPVVAVVQPLGVEMGETVRLRVRGRNFDGVSNAVVKGWKDVPIEISARGDATAIAGLDAARVGDKRLELSMKVPVDAREGTNTTLVLVGPGGESIPFPLVVLPKGGVLSGKEPNDGFRDAPGATVPTVLRGGFEAKGDVDVFRVRLVAGKRFRAEILASRVGSTLDATLSLYDERHALVKAVDDTWGRDPVLEADIADGGEYFIAVGYVNDQAAPTHEYLLFLTQP